MGGEELLDGQLGSQQRSFGVVFLQQNREISMSVVVKNHHYVETTAPVTEIKTLKVWQSSGQSR